MISQCIHWYITVQKYICIVKVKHSTAAQRVNVYRWSYIDRNGYWV